MDTKQSHHNSGKIEVTSKWLFFFSSWARYFNGTIPQLGKQANDDLFGTGGKVRFLEWMAAILVIAVAAKSIDLPDAGKALLVLIVLVFLIRDKGLLNQIASQITSLKAPGGGSGAAASAPATSPGAGSIGGTQANQFGLTGGNPAAVGGGAPVSATNPGSVGGVQGGQFPLTIAPPTGIGG